MVACLHLPSWKLFLVSKYVKGIVDIISWLLFKLEVRAKRFIDSQIPQEVK